jgi:REP element-mobilizing transposase RayT
MRQDVGATSQSRHPTTPIPERGSRELRKGRFSQEGALYFITFSCRSRRKLFHKQEQVQVIHDCLAWLSEKDFIDVHFCIVMPDHVHLVLQLVGGKSLSEVVKSLKQYTSRQIRTQLALAGPVWQDQYHDHMIRKGESLSEIIQYCWFNPVRAGIVENPSDYPFWRSKDELDEGRLPVSSPHWLGMETQVHRKPVEAGKPLPHG